MISAVKCGPWLELSSQVPSFSLFSSAATVSWAADCLHEEVVRPNRLLVGEKSLNRSVKVEHEKIFISLFSFSSLSAHIFFLTWTWKMISITPRILYTQWKRRVYEHSRASSRTFLRENKANERHHRLWIRWSSLSLDLHVTWNVEKLFCTFSFHTHISHAPHIHFALLMSPFVSPRVLCAAVHICLLWPVCAQMINFQASSSLRSGLHWAMNIKSFRVASCEARESLLKVIIPIPPSPKREKYVEKEIKLRST